VLLERLASQLLTGPPAPSAEDVVRRLLAVQGQDLRGARLAVRARSVGLTAADVDAGLTDRRSLVISWLNRGTLHLVSAEDYWWLHPLTTPQLVTGNARRLREEGVSPAQADAGVEVVLAAVAGRPRTRPELKALLDDAGVPTARQALVHVLLAATLRGSVVRGPLVDGQHAFVDAEQWLGPPPGPLERDAALARLARRYLVGHGPAAPADLAKWAGIPLGAARAGLRALAEDGQAVASGADDGDAADGDVVDVVDLVDRVPAAGLPPPRLLGAFEPLLLGWASRDDVVGRFQGLVTVNGIFHPCALVDGRVVGTWGLAGGVVTLRLLDDVPADAVDRLAADAVDVARYLGIEARPAVIAS
jgi:hypothetical protein